MLYLKHPTFKGSVGEARVNRRLNSALNDNEYQVIENLTLPAGSGTTQIDHVVVCTHGIFVIETKNMAGWIFGNAKQARWTQVLHRHKSQFQNPLRQNYKHIRVVEELLSIEATQLHNLVVFVGSAKPKTAMPENVLWSAQKLTNYIQSKHEVFFTKAECNDFAHRLKNAALEPNRKTNRDHVKGLKSQATIRRSNLTACPNCEAKMVERANAKSGEKFFGCSRYPKCKGTRKNIR